MGDPGSAGMSTALTPCQWQSNESALALLLSRKQMPVRTQFNLGKDTEWSEQVKTWGQPKGSLNKNSKMLWKEPGDDCWSDF